MHQKAFSLIELMVVIAVVGLLAAVAAPSYKNYVTRGKYSELVSLLQGFKSEVATAHSTDLQWPTDVNGTNAGQNRDLLTTEPGYELAWQFHYNSQTSPDVAWWGYRLRNYGNNAHLFMCVRYIGNTLSVFCGPWGSTTDNEATEVRSFLPASCQDAILNDCVN